MPLPPPTTSAWDSHRSTTWEPSASSLLYFGNPNELPPTVHITTAHFLIANFTALFAICLLCHGEIVRTRPAPQYLTSFYLMISAGGAIGAIFATIIAPLLFTTYFEWDAALFIACLASLAIVILGLCCTLRAQPQFESESSAPLTPALRTSGHCIIRTRAVVARHPDRRQRTPRFGVSKCSLERPKFFRHAHHSRKRSRRRVLESLRPFHGTTQHGSQFTSKPRNREPTTYFSHQTGVGRAIDYFHKHLPPGQLRLGVVGLGAGTLAAYPDAGDSITFYEINPTVIQLAENGDWFTYVRDCRARGAHCDIRLGDARLTLQRENSLRGPTRQRFRPITSWSSMPSAAIPFRCIC